MTACINQQANHSRAFARLLVYVPLLCCSVANISHADDTSAMLLPALDITDTLNTSPRQQADQAEGKYELNRHTLEQLGGVNGSMTGVLDTLPNLQYSDDANTPETQTSLKPQSVSISGGRYYDNNFSINGISNNSLLGPANGSTSDASLSDVPGHEQAIFFDLDQLESITVYDSNVPAEYGRFTGGVIDAQIRRPGGDTKTRISHFTTRSDWVDYKIITGRDSAEDPAYEPPAEPEFSRSRTTLSHERAINDDHSLRLGLTHQQSQTPGLSLGKTAYTREELVSYSATHGLLLLNGTEATTMLSYSPYEKDTYLENVKDSAYQLQGGGILLNTDISTYIGQQQHEFTLSLSNSEQSRSAPSALYNWLNTPSRNWGLQAGLGDSKEGGNGDLDKYQNSLGINWKTATAFSSFRLVYGTQILHSQAGFERPENTLIYRSPVINTAIQCAGQTTDCVQREQYFRERQIYPADKVAVDLTELAAFSEAEFSWQRLQLTLGARIDHDNFLNNTNIAWRSRGVYDLSGNNTVLLNAGVNRYYSGPLLTYKLRQASRPYFQEYRGSTQNVVNAWEYDTETGTFKYEFNDVRTPYSDEITAGLRANILQGVAELKLLARDNNDEFGRTTTDVQSDGYRYYRMNNDGYSRYRSVSLNWDGQFNSLTTGINITWSKTESSNDTYDDGIDAATSNEDVWYNNERRTLSDISQLREDFARPLIANAYVHSPLGAGFSGMLKARYKEAYTTIVQGSGTHFTGVITDDNGNSVAEYLLKYEDKRQAASVLLDARIEWQPLLNNHLMITAEINNLLNRRTYSVNTQSDGIETGRSLWLGAALEF